MATYERRSVFLPPEAEQRSRYTCRDEEGRARLMPDVYLMDAVEHLCRIEERSMGVMIQGRTENKEARAQETIKRRWEEQKRDKG